MIPQGKCLPAFLGFPPLTCVEYTQCFLRVVGAALPRGFRAGVAALEPVEFALAQEPLPQVVSLRWECRKGA